MTKEEAEAFEALPSFAALLAMRDWDDKAKVEHQCFLMKKIITFPSNFFNSLTVEYVLIFHVQGPHPSCDEYGTVEGNGSTTYDLDLQSMFRLSMR